MAVHEYGNLLQNFPEAACVVGHNHEMIYSNGHGLLANLKSLPPELIELVTRFAAREPAGQERMVTLSDPHRVLDVRLSRVGEPAESLTLVRFLDVTNEILLEEKMLHRSEELSILYEISALETERQSMDTIVSQVADKLLELTALENWLFLELEAGNGGCFRVRESQRNLAPPAWALEILADEKLTENLKGVSAALWRTGQELHIDVRSAMDRVGIGTFVKIPIVVRGTQQGVLLLASSEASPVRVHDNIRFFEMIRRQLGSALERAELFYALEESFREIDRKNRQLAGELQLAQKLQTGILEIQFPHKPELEFVVKYIPSYHLGGDFYDVFELPENRVGVLIADVCGHGVSSALITTFLKAAAKDLSQNLGDAAQLLNRLNQKLLPVLPLGMFVSAFYLVIDTDGRMLHFSNGGHPLPLYYDSATDRLHELEVEGRLLSVTKESVYETRSISYNPGDKVFLFTDGLYEIEDPDGKFLGPKHVDTIIKQHRSQPARVVVEKLMESVYAFAGSQDLRDDVNLIGIDLKG